MTQNPLKQIGDEAIRLARDLAEARAELARKAEYSRQYLADTDAQTEHLGHVIEGLHAKLKLAEAALAKIETQCSDHLTHTSYGDCSGCIARQALHEMRK